MSSSSGSTARSAEAQLMEDQAITCYSTEGMQISEHGGTMQTEADDIVKSSEKLLSHSKSPVLSKSTSSQSSNIITDYRQPTEQDLPPMVIADSPKMAQPHAASNRLSPLPVSAINPDSGRDSSTTNIPKVASTPNLQSTLPNNAPSHINPVAAAHPSLRNEGGNNFFLEKAAAAPPQLVPRFSSHSTNTPGANYATLSADTLQQSQTLQPLQHLHQQHQQHQMSVPHNVSSPTSSPHSVSPTLIRPDRNRASSASPKRRVQTDSPPHRSNSHPDQDTVVHTGKESIEDLLSSEPSSQNNFFERPDVNLQLKKEIGMPTMTSFQQYVIQQLPIRWREFGHCLGISHETLEDIERKNSGRNLQSCFIDVFRYWENHKNELQPFLWKTVADILDSPLFACPNVVNAIRQEFIPQPSSLGEHKPMFLRENFPPPDYPQSMPSRLLDSSHVKGMHSSHFIPVSGLAQAPPSLLPPQDLHSSPLSLPQAPSSAFTSTNFFTQQSAELKKSKKPVTSSANVLPSPNAPYDIPNAPRDITSRPDYNVPSAIPHGYDDDTDIPFASLPSSLNQPPPVSGLGGAGGYPPMLENFGTMRQNFPQIQGSHNVHVPAVHPPSLTNYPVNYPIELRNAPVNYPPVSVNAPVNYPPVSVNAPVNYPPGYPLIPMTHQPVSAGGNLQPNPSPHVPYPSNNLPVQYHSQSRFPGSYQSLPGSFPSRAPIPAFTQVPVQPSRHRLAGHSEAVFSPTPLVRAPVSATTATPQLPGTTVQHQTTTPQMAGTMVQHQTTAPQLTGTAMQYQVTPPQLTGTAMQYQVTTPQLTGTMETAIEASDEHYDQDKSTSSFYSAPDEQPEDAAPPSLTRSSQDSWTKLIQKYMRNLEQKHQPALPPALPPNGRSLSPRRQPKQKKDEKTYLQKDLEKAYERISSLEVRVQDLTAQVTYEIPEDKDLHLLPSDKLQQDFKKMRELKKKAEQQSMESKQTAQRLIAENFRLKEELSQMKNDRDMLIADLRRQQRKTNEREQFKDEKVEALRKSFREVVAMNIKDLELPASRGGTPLIAEVSDYPSVEFTPELLWKVITDRKSELTVGQIGVVGLPSSGKSTLLKALLSKEIGGKVPKPKGEPTCMEFYEVVSQKNPLTGDSQWKMASGLESAVHYFATATAQYYFSQKQAPSFAMESVTDSLNKMFPDVADATVKNTLGKVFKEVRALLQKEKKRDGMTQLALFQPVFMNIWDMGVNRCLYQFVPVVAGHCDHLLILDVVDLERDVPCLDEPPVLSSDVYKKRGDDKLVMQLYSKLDYLMLLAGLKRWFNRDPNSLEAPEVTIVGTYTKEFAGRDGGQAKRDSLIQLQRHVKAAATKFKIDYAIDPQVLTYCIDGEKELQERELLAVKQTMEKMISAKPNSKEPFNGSWMLLRSIFYNPNILAVSQEELEKLARSCGIYTSKELNECLMAFRNVGSILYNPELESSIAQSQVVIDIPRMLEHLDRLFYIDYYQSTGALHLSREEEEGMRYYKYGLVTKAVAEKVFTKQDLDICVEYLGCCKVCVPVEVGKETMYFMPALRRDHRQFTPNLASLYIQYYYHYAQCDQVVLFHKFLQNHLPREKVEFIPNLEYNVTSFVYTYENEKALTVEVIYHTQVIEVYVFSPNRKEGLLNMSLCSSLLELCREVFNEVCKDIQDLKYDFSVVCPNSSVDDPHFVSFYSQYDSPVLFCSTCNIGIDKDTINDDRSHWLHGIIKKDLSN